MNDKNILVPQYWNKALIDCVISDKNIVLKEGEKIDHRIIEKLVQVSTIPSWNSNVHKYKF